MKASSFSGSGFHWNKVERKCGEPCFCGSTDSFVCRSLYGRMICRARPSAPFSLSTGDRDAELGNWLFPFFQVGRVLFTEAIREKGGPGCQPVTLWCSSRLPRFWLFLACQSPVGFPFKRFFFHLSPTTTKQYRNVSKTPKHLSTLFLSFFSSSVEFLNLLSPAEQKKKKRFSVSLSFFSFIFFY